MVRMIAVDMDGTLLGEDGKVGPANLAAIHAAERSGIRVVVATGRRHCYAMRQLRGLGLAEDSVLVSSNGAVTRLLGNGARLLDRTVLAAETSRWLCAHLAEFRNALVVTFDRVGLDGEDTRGALVVEQLEDLHASIGKWMAANEPYIDRIQPIERALASPDAPIQMMLCGSVERMRRAEARLLEHPGVAAVYNHPDYTHPDGIAPLGLKHTAQVALSRTEYPDRDLSIVDILPAGCSKGAALTRLAATWDIQPAQMMAIGDNWNDLSMLEIAGFPVLMENAPEDLKDLAAQRGWRIGGHHAADGVAQAIEQAMSLNRPTAMLAAQ